MLLRIAADLLLIFSLVTLPAWVTIVSALLFFFVFSHYVELMIVGFLIDALFGFSGALLWGFQYIYTTVTVILYIGLSRTLRHSRFDRAIL